MRDELEQVRLPDAEAASERAAAVVLAAFADREPVPQRSSRARLVGAALVLAAVAIGLAVVSPPGRAVVDRVREAVGIERSAPALFSLPGGGRLLVGAADGVWVVEAGGKQRLLAGYREATWSPFGRFLVATRKNELAALEPDGDVRWTLARPGAHSPRWAGTETDTRIAYADRTGIRIVAGDGTGDRLLLPSGSGPVAWRPGPGHLLAYSSGTELRVQDTDSGQVLLRRTLGASRATTRIEWSSDGQRLLVLAPDSLQVLGPQGRLVSRNDPPDGTVNVDATFQPGTHRVLVARRHGAQSTVFDLATGRTLFHGTGVFEQVAVSPDGRWLAIDWPTADQWVFVRTDRPRAIRAVSGVSAQFRSRPAFSGWCCA